MRYLLGKRQGNRHGKRMGDDDRNRSILNGALEFPKALQRLMDSRLKSEDDQEN